MCRCDRSRRLRQVSLELNVSHDPLLPHRMTAEATRVGEPVIDVTELTRRFDSTTALDPVSLSMPRGAVYGLVGANGAGKTTLIQHLPGPLRAESRSVRVVGCDAVADPVGRLALIGCL